MHENLIIIGASGHGKVAADIALKLNTWKRIAFLDDDTSKKSSMGLKIVGKVSDALQYKRHAAFFVAIGNNSVREILTEELLDQGFLIASLIHPQAIIGHEVKIEQGTIIMAGAVINSSTTIGTGSIINTGASIDHDNNLDDYVHISPGARTAGNVFIGKKSWLGIGSMISNNIYICENCTIGAGAVVTKDITESGTYIGVPVRRMKECKS